MTNKITIALPYVGARYYLTTDNTVDSSLEFKLWGGGGGGGGRDSRLGGSGAGGNFVAGSALISSGKLVEVFVGEGGVTGSSTSGGGGGNGGRSELFHAGGMGGAAGWSGWSGGGGGGGGATLLKIGNSIQAVAGGGGGGGGGGQYSAGTSASGEFSGSTDDVAYSNGGTLGAWCNFLNTYSIWEGNGSYTWRVYFPTTGDYTFSGSIDNYGILYIDDSAALAINGFTAVYSTVGYVNAGWRTIRIDAVNTGGPGALSARITNSNGDEIWNTRYPKNFVGHGKMGQNHDGDGGGAGGGGGGFIGGAGGTAPWGDIGAYAGYSGANYLIGHNYSDSGMYASYTIPGGISDVNYPGNIGHGGAPSGANGEHGAALITFNNSIGISIRVESQYKKTTSYVKIGGSYRPTIPWVKQNNVWTQIRVPTNISFSQDSTNWGY